MIYIQLYLPRFILASPDEDSTVGRFLKELQKNSEKYYSEGEYDKLAFLLEKSKPFKGATGKQKARFYYLLAKAYRNPSKITSAAIQLGWRKALDYLPYSIKLNPKEPEVYIELGEIQTEIGCDWGAANNLAERDIYLNAALKNISKALSFKRPRISILKYLGEVHRCKKDFKKAVIFFKKFLEKGGRKESIFLELDFLKRDLLQAQKQDPSNVLFRQLLSTLNNISK